jgi:hypothetical protein
MSLEYLQIRKCYLEFSGVCVCVCVCVCVNTGILSLGERVTYTVHLNFCSKLIESIN